MKGVFAVVGATGQVGRVVAERLAARGHEVRRISRGDGVRLEDGRALRRAFYGASGAFLMIPSESKASSMRGRQRELGSSLAEALKSARTRRAVFLSSLGAQWGEGTGPVLGLRDMEERLNALGIAEMTHLRSAYFMENLLQSVESIGRSGAFNGALRSDLAMPMVSCRDVGEKAAEILEQELFREPRVINIVGPREYALSEAVKILARAIGKSYLICLEHPLEDFRRDLLRDGFSADCAGSLIDLTRAINEGRIVPGEHPCARGKTSLEEFARTDFKPAFEARFPAAAVGV